MSPIRVTHVISGLQRGGAETMLYRLLAALDPASVASEVVTLTDGGVLGPDIRALGVPVREVGMRRGGVSLPGFLRLCRMIKGGRPQVVQTWMYHADLLGGAAGRLSRTGRILWSIHHANLGWGVNKASTLLTARICGLLSAWIPDRILCVSEAAVETHVDFGYARSAFEVVPNGVELRSFKPDAEARRAMRASLGIGEERILIGLVGRFHPQKDHGNFLAAAGKVKRALPDADFLLCGQGADAGNGELRRWIAEAGLEGSCRLLGERKDIPAVLNGLDVFCSSSRGEGFSVAICEAMACGVPCVVTDVGDSARIVAGCGTAVPARDPDALSGALLAMASLPAPARARLGEESRRRILENFSLEAVSERYVALYRSLLERA